MLKYCCFSCSSDAPLDELVDKAEEADEAYEIKCSTIAISPYISHQSSSNPPFSDYQLMSNQILQLKVQLAEVRLERDR